MSEEESPEISMKEILEEHKDRWVALIVTKRDKNGQPISGKIVSEDVDRYRLRQNVARYNDICILYAGESQFPLFL